MVVVGIDSGARAEDQKRVRLGLGGGSVLSGDQCPIFAAAPCSSPSLCPVRLRHCALRVYAAVPCASLPLRPGVPSVAPCASPPLCPAHLRCCALRVSAAAPIASPPLPHPVSATAPRLYHLYPLSSVASLSPEKSKAVIIGYSSFFFSCKNRDKEGWLLCI
ncbi:hypothetical protein ZIOFF_010200 [Zingiber officinale]|uniref:Uncharacterized protein n=1 Tax=Zingiber officinale TaxID=94328 RepID=A0A8J5LY49_ZINOF|nr:hypothetical protein ZIOFF_010200 [Zingiber officinale]